MRRTTSEWTATASMRRSVRLSPRYPSAHRALASIALNSTRGSRTISPATGVPLGKENPHGTQAYPRPRPASRDLAHRQTHLRAENLPEHWNSSTRRSGTLPRESDGTDPTSSDLRRPACANFRTGGGEVRAGAPAQAEHPGRREPPEGAHAVDRIGSPRSDPHGHAAAVGVRPAESRGRGRYESIRDCRSSGAS